MTSAHERADGTAPAPCGRMISRVNGATSAQFQRVAREAKESRALIDALQSRRLLATLALFTAVSCIAGGFELIVWRNGNRHLPSVALLAHTPFDNFLVPGLMLAFIVGGASLACAILVWRNTRTAIDAVILAGGSLSVWMIAEIAILRLLDPLSVGYALLGFTLLGAGVRAAWRTREPRYRWLIVVTLAEACGFIAPALTGIATSAAGIEGFGQALLLVAAGAVEGLVLGAGQAWAFPLRVRKAHYAAWTALAAALAWASAMTVGSLMTTATLPTAILIMAWVSAGVVMLLAIGTAQWLELRHASRKARQWIAWTALAWLLALPLSFAPGPFVDETTPLTSQILLWGTGGMLMAFVMALVTWQGARRVCSAAWAVTPGTPKNARDQALPRSRHPSETP